MNKENKKILVIDDEPKIRNILKDILEHKNYHVITSKDGKEGLEVLESQYIDLVLLDLVIPGIGGIEILKQIMLRDPYLPVIIISAHGNIPVAMETSQIGAVDFIEKPISMDDLLPRINKQLKKSYKKREEYSHSREIYERYGMIGTSKEMMDVYQLIDKAASTDIRVLITGETGTGKELVAHAIHSLSSRAENPFIRINCAAIPSELIESELFGYKKGAFTGALRDKTGKFQLAHEGTLFLDEIGDMRAMTQAKVLCTLEDGEVHPVGSTEVVRTDVRILAATNKNLEEEISIGKFREDLYYRLNVVTIHLPALKDRKDDIPYLVRHFIEYFCDEYNRKQMTLTKKAMELLVRHNWTGNIRELKNFIEKLVIMVNEDLLDFSHVSTLLGRQSTEKNFEMNVPLREAREQFELNYITAKLIANEWNVPLTAKELGIARTALYRKMQQLGIKQPENQKNQ